MKRGLDGEMTPEGPAINPEKSYSYTWPGQPARTVLGEELIEILKGADHTQLNIQEVGGMSNSYRSSHYKKDDANE